MDAGPRGRAGCDVMPAGGQRLSTLVVDYTALGGLSWGIIAVVLASVGPSEFVPHVFHSYHVEHFAAFYLIALLAAAGFPSAQLYQDRQRALLDGGRSGERASADTLTIESRMWKTFARTS